MLQALNKVLCEPATTAPGRCPTTNQGQLVTHGVTHKVLK